MPYPQEVLISEVGPRDGFQMESLVIPTDVKLAVITGLVDAGLQEIQVASFVHPERVPQMADAGALIRRLPARPEILFTALVLNAKGLERALQSGIRGVEISVSASDTHSRRNTGLPFAEAEIAGERMIRLAKSAGIHTRASIQCAFGCVFEGEVPEARLVKTAARFLNAGADLLGLADTTGMGTPLQVARRVKAVARLAGGAPLALHLHDTRGLGLVNALAGLEAGISVLDTALGGMGGCPFVPGAAGNIATEDTIHLLEALRIRTGIDIRGVARQSLRLEEILLKKLPGKMHRLLS